jgi:hypothetical protein
VNKLAKSWGHTSFLLSQVSNSQSKSKTTLLFQAKKKITSAGNSNVGNVKKSLIYIFKFQVFTQRPRNGRIKLHLHLSFINNMCMHACIHTYTHTHIYIDAYIQRCIHTYIDAYIHTYIHTCTHIHTYTHTYIHTYIHTLPSEPDSAMRTSADQISSSHPTATFCRFQGIEPATFRCMLENISADILRVWLSGYILQHEYIHTRT